MIACVLAALLAASTPAAGTLAAVADEAGFQGVILSGAGPVPAVVQRGPDGPRAVWRWASVTKQLTALIAMQEVAAGHLDLDRSVASYWPEWPQVYSDEITIRNLMQHTSGLADPNEDGPDLPDGLPAFYRPAAGAGTMAFEATHYCAEHPRAKPGGAFHYDNCDYIVLGALIERITGKPYATLVEERIARPLHLRIGVFSPGQAARAQVAGVDKAGHPDLLGDLGTYGASGSAYGPPLALYAFDRALMTHRLLDAKTTETMWTGDPKLGSAALGQWEYRAPLAGCPAPVRIVERRGQIGGVQVRNFMFPETGRALVLFTPREALEFGEVWMGKGFSYRIASAAACGS